MMNYTFRKRKEDKYGYICDFYHNAKVILIYCEDLHSVEYHKIHMIYRNAIIAANTTTQPPTYYREDTIRHQGGRKIRKWRQAKDPKEEAMYPFRSVPSITGLSDIRCYTCFVK
jgi:hypothetical protein